LALFYGPKNKINGFLIGNKNVNTVDKVLFSLPNRDNYNLNKRFAIYAAGGLIEGACYLRFYLL
jgi:hypothetical protein